MSQSNETRKKIGVIGAGGQADETISYLNNDHDLVFRAVDPEYVRDEQLIDVMNPNIEHSNLPVVAAIGAPAIRKMLVEKWPGETYHTVISEHAIIDKSAVIGEGCIIAPRAVITTNVEVGAHTIVNLAATISHDTKIGEYVTISPGAHIGGHVVIHDGAFIGMGAVVKNKVEIASGVMVGAGAVIVKDLEEENTIYMGVPAKKYGQNEGWVSEV